MSPHETAVERLTERVARIPLPLPLPGLSAVNCYAIIGDDDISLVDPGWSTPESEAALHAALEDLGASLGDVGRCLITHHHWDHIALAARWQRDHGTPFLLGREERLSLEAFARTGRPYAEQMAQLRRAGAPEIATAVEAVAWEPYEAGIEVGAADTWLVDGDEIDCGGHSILAISTPGHTRGHVVFHDPEADLLFTGDHILPRITPAIGLEAAPERLPLGSYMDSLRLFVERPDGRMLPAHGAVADSTRTRAEELLDHHRDRLDLVADLVGRGWSTGAEVARQMTWTRHDRTIDELPPVHGLTAVVEVVSHLDVLAAQGRLSKDDSTDLTTYSVLSPG